MRADPFPQFGYNKMNIDEEHTKGGKRTSTEQQEVLLDFLTTNKIIITGKTLPMNTHKIEDLWKTLGLKLNSCSGARKSVIEWERFFVEWKSKTRKKARNIKVDVTATGGGPCTNRGLTDIEERLLTCISGWVSVDGHEDVAEQNILDAHSDEEYLDNIGEYVLSDIAEHVLDDEIQYVPPAKKPRSGNTSGKTHLLKIPKVTQSRPMQTTSDNLVFDSAKMYLESTKIFCEAIHGFSSSISELAAAINKHADAQNREN